MSGSGPNVTCKTRTYPDIWNRIDVSDVNAASLINILFDYAIKLGIKDFSELNIWEEWNVREMSTWMVLQCYFFFLINNLPEAFNLLYCIIFRKPLNFLTDIIICPVLLWQGNSWRMTVTSLDFLSLQKKKKK